jgi:hypothetical protein
MMDLASSSFIPPIFDHKRPDVKRQYRLLTTIRGSCQAYPVVVCDGIGNLTTGFTDSFRPLSKPKASSFE